MNTNFVRRKNVRPSKKVPQPSQGCHDKGEGIRQSVECEQRLETQDEIADRVEPQHELYAWGDHIGRIGHRAQNHDSHEDYTDRLLEIAGYEHDQTEEPSKADHEHNKQDPEHRYQR